MPTDSQQAKFRQDALRWVVPGQVAEDPALTFSLLIKLLYHHMPLRAMGWYRLSCWCQEKRIPAISGFIVRWLYFRFGLEIWGDIAGGLYIAHPIGTVIAVKSMGENCSVIASVTFGMRNELAFPTVGKGVLVGAGARILGDITVGDHAKIGANAVVVNDVAANSTMVGIPAKPLASNRFVESVPAIESEEQLEPERHLSSEQHSEL